MKNNSNEESDLITPAEAARVRGVTKQAITDLMRRGRLRVREIGGRSFLYKSEVQSFTPEITGRPPKPSSTEKTATRKPSASNGASTSKKGKK